jgi:two-component system, cell cycle sensor histidine kinase and response regulator CckA
VRHDATAILTAAEQAQTMTRELLAFTRRQVRDVTTVRVSDVLHRAAPLLTRLLPTHHRLVIRGAAHDARVVVDENELQLALLNLVANARDAMADDDGVVTVGYSVVDVTAVEHGALRVPPGRFVHLVVEDTGPGLSDEARAHLFEPFFTTKPVGKGSGIGLATVYSVVQAVGGTVTYEHAPGGAGSGAGHGDRRHGARFSRWLPAATEPTSHVDARRGTGDGRIMKQQPSSVRVVVVDDDASVLAVAARALRGHGYSVMTASCGSDALDLMAAHPDTAVLVIDFVMPDMNGRQVLEATAARFPHVRCVLMSGYTPNAETRDALVGAGTAFVAKPFSVADLVATVQQVLETMPRVASTGPSGAP